MVVCDKHGIGTMKLKLLLIEDSQTDAVRTVVELETAGYAVEFLQVYTRQAVQQALSSGDAWDLIISGHSLPGFSSIDVLFILLKMELDIPLIIVSDSIGDEMAVAVMKAGAHDFVMKDHLSRLGPAVKNALETAQARRCAQEYQQRLRELTTHIQTVREEERAAIARDIHDEIGGLLTAIKMDVRWLQRNGCENCDEAGIKFEDMSGHLDYAIKCVRRIITDLRPSVLDDLGLLAALEWQLEEFARRYEVKTHFFCDEQNISCPRNEHDIAVFRIFQESLTNIAKHAQASEVWVQVKPFNGHFLLTISDNGVGITDANKQKPGSYGLMGMNERARALGGSFSICNREQGGARAELRLPCA